MVVCLEIRTTKSHLPVADTLIIRALGTYQEQSPRTSSGLTSKSNLERLYEAVTSRHDCVGGSLLLLKEVIPLILRHAFSKHALG